LRAHSSLIEQQVIHPELTSCEGTIETKAAMDQRNGILLIRLKSMGDVIFTLPAVHNLRVEKPTARICFLVSREYASLLQGFQEVNSVIELDRECFRGLHPVKIAGAAWTLFRRMRAERLGLTIDLQGYGETGLLTRLSGAPQRWGTVYRPGRSWVYTQAVQRRVDIHPVDDYLQVLRLNGIEDTPIRNEFVLPKRSLEEARVFFASQGLSLSRPTLFIQPFTSAAVKNWPLSRYLETAHYWQQRGWQILFGGGPADRTGLEPAKQAGFSIAAGVPLLVSAGLVSLSSLILGGDTGLLHLAVAMGKRVVMVMRGLGAGSSYPFQHRDWAIAPKNYVIDTITPNLVIEACAQASADLGISV
jgi:ADP-heptose:LPS heptosyltransferase